MLGRVSGKFQAGIRRLYAAGGGGAAVPPVMGLGAAGTDTSSVPLTPQA